MTINLFGVRNALGAEDDRQRRLENALTWKFRKWDQKPEEEPEASSDQVSSSPEEAR